MLLQLAQICTYIALASPLIASKSLFFPFITGKIIFFRIFTELALLCVVGALTYGKIPLENIKNLVKKPIFIITTLFTALFTLSAFTAQNPSFAFWSNFERGEGAWQIIHYFIFFCLILVLFKDKNDWKRLMGVQTAIATLVGLYAVGQIMNWKWIIDPNINSVSGTLGNPDYLGIYMILSGFFALWLAYENRGNKRLFWFFCAAFEIALFFAAKSRGSFVGVGIGLIFMLVLWLFQQKRGWKSNSIAGITAILIIYSISTLVFTVKGGNAINDIQPRLWTWGSALSGTIERPLLGWGPENFPFIFDAYYNPKHYQIESWFDRAHNVPLEYLTTGGIPLFLAYMSIFAVLYRRLMRRKNDSLWPIFMALPLIYFINGIFLFETLPVYVIFFLLIAFTDAFTNDFINEQSVHKAKMYYKKPLIQASFFILCILVPVSLYATAYRPLQKNRMILEAMQTNNKNDIQLFKEHEAILMYSSPVGQQEELQGLLTFTVSYFDYLETHKLMAEVSKQKIDTIMQFNAEWYEKLKKSTIGVKTLYIRVTGLLAAYQMTKDAAYLTEADKLIVGGAAIAPTRIEFVRFTMASAQLHNDRATYEKALAKGKLLLPTLAWEPDMAKFKY